MLVESKQRICFEFHRKYEIEEQFPFEDNTDLAWQKPGRAEMLHSNCDCECAKEENDREHEDVW